MKTKNCEKKNLNNEKYNLLWSINCIRRDGNVWHKTSVMYRFEKIFRKCIGTRVQRFIHTHSEESEGIISEDADTQINPNLYCSVLPNIYHIFYGHILTIFSHLQWGGNV